MNLLMKAPSTFVQASTVIFKDGTTAQVDANGNLTVPSQFVADMLALGFTYYQLPETQYNAVASSSTSVTMTASKIAGAKTCVLRRTGSPGGGVTETTPTAAEIVAAIIGAAAGQTYNLQIINGTGQTLTITAGEGVTFTGTAGLANAKTGNYLVTLTSLTAVAIQEAGIYS